MRYDQRFTQVFFSQHDFPMYLYMRKFFRGVCLFLCLLPSSLFAEEITLAWDPPSTEYGGFIIGYGNESGLYQHTQDVGGQTISTVAGLNPGETYYFAVKAYNPARDLESPYSNQVSVTVPAPDTIPPASPQQVKIY